MECLHAGGHGPRACQFVQFWVSWGAKFIKIGDSLPWMPMNCHAKFDAARFILVGEICNRTKLQKHIQTVTDISTPCLSACVDK